jgi:hypothetical protein
MKGTTANCEASHSIPKPGEGTTTNCDTLHSIPKPEVRLSLDDGHGAEAPGRNHAIRIEYYVLQRLS